MGHKMPEYRFAWALPLRVSQPQKFTYFSRPLILGCVERCALELDTLLLYVPGLEASHELAAGHVRFVLINPPSLILQLLSP